MLTLWEIEYYGVAQEISRAEDEPKKEEVSAPWYTIVPTNLVKLRAHDTLPEFEVR